MVKYNIDFFIYFFNLSLVQGESISPVGIQGHSQTLQETQKPLESLWGQGGREVQAHLPPNLQYLWYLNSTHILSKGQKKRTDSVSTRPGKENICAEFSTAIVYVYTCIIQGRKTKW